MMIHSYRYINKYRQFDTTNYTLIIEARENDLLINTYRIEKCFKVNENLIDDEFLRAYAYKEIDRIISESQEIEQLYIAEQIVTEEVIPEEIVTSDPPPAGDEPGVI
jgi:hypothetical protein